MKKLIPVLLLISLIGVGVCLIYQEVLAWPIPCYLANNFCTIQCVATFSLGECWESEGQIYCYFTCSAFNRQCGWQDPTNGTCVGPLY